MKSSWTALRTNAVVVLLSAVEAVGHTNSPIPFELVAKPMQSAFTVGERVAAEVVLRNTGTNTVIIPHTHLLAIYALDLQLPSGASAPFTLYGKRLYDIRTEIIQRRFAPLAPGESTTNTVHLSTLFDMTLAGGYELRVSRKVPVQDGTNTRVEEIVSKPILITVKKP